MAEVKRRRKTAVAGIAPSEPERDILDQYLYEVSTYPLLKGTEEIEVARRIRAGDPDALQELVQRNLRFVISVAKKYQNRGMPLIDLIGEGNVGLLTAARKFDPDQGVKFISYAVWWIRQAILSSLARQGRTVRVPLNRTADLSRIIKASEILRQKLNREPTPEELDLARKIRAGDPDALQELVKRNLRFVISVAKKYQNRGLPLIDLIGEGNVGLLTAARKFDPDQGVKFISYAVWWIRQAILSSLARQGRTVRVPLNRTADLSRIIKASEILRQKLRREPTPEELSQLTGLSVDVVQSLAALNTGDVRLDAPMDPEGDRSLIERFVADEMPATEEEAMNRFLTDEIEVALGTLPPRDARVLKLYFGLEGGREHTLEEIGSLLGVTRERVRQLRDRALKRLREGDVGRALGSFAA